MNNLRNDEKVVFALRELYGKYGYTQYKMNKFEEYDLYAKNKDFLVSGNVITFTDTNGRLLALKPDVTLSIIKNGEDIQNGLQKVYYNENVYRVSGATHAFREIMQVGLECVGAVDTYAVCEVLLLAAASLERISDDSVLDVSHLGVVSNAISALGISESATAEIVKCIGEKNRHGISEICEREAANERATEQILRLVSTYGTLREVLPQLIKLASDYPENTAISELITICRALGDEKKINIDFSVTSNMNYYNGVVFCGFVRGIPTGVLSGGQYDSLMCKLGKKSRAIGFAVYLDLLEDLSYEREEFDVDVILVYGEKDSVGDIKAAADRLISEGKSVSVQRCVPEKLRAREIVRL
ncbi:MAG: hypothetical protein E7640_05215 [Ruminococcaceae bacterium]|nr:hypothetical protein [Oscillospiraceae bacterium]